MKKILLIFAALLFVFAGCQKDELNKQSEEEVVEGNYEISATLEEPNAGEAKTVLTSKDGVNWCKNDKIAVFGADNSKYELTTTSTTKNGIFKGTVPKGFVAKYAIYPSSEEVNPSISGSKITFTLPATQKYANNSFGNGYNVAVGQVADKSKFVLKNAFGLLEICLKGRNEKVMSITVTSRKNERLNGVFTVDASTTSAAVAKDAYSAAADKKITLDCGTGVKLQADVDKQTNFYIVVPAGALKSGFSVAIKVKNNTTGNTRTETISTTKDNSIKRSVIKAMPVKTLVIDLGGPSTTYLVTEPGFYCFDATVKGNGYDPQNPSTKATIDPKKIHRAAMIWEYTNSNPATANILNQADAVYYEDGYIFFSTVYSGLTNGTAVIAALTNDEPYINGSGNQYEAGPNVLWTWQIWSSKTKPAEVTIGGKTFMDRNLGAIAKTDAGAMGLLYQWGRKDPMTGFINFSGGHGISTYGGDNYNHLTNGQQEIPYEPAVGLSFSNYLPDKAYDKYNGRKNNFKAGDDKRQTIAWSVANPRLFIKGSTTAMHWNKNNYLNLWGASKTMYDPCPTGYKVPAAADFSGFPAAGKLTPANNGVTINSNFWPCTGMRGLDNTRALSSVTDANYWTSTAKKVSDPNVPGQYVATTLNAIQDKNTYAGLGISYCVSANPIRCVKE